MPTVYNSLFFRIIFFCFREKRVQTEQYAKTHNSTFGKRTYKQSHSRHANPNLNFFKIEKAYLSINPYSFASLLSKNISIHIQLNNY